MKCLPSSIAFLSYGDLGQPQVKPTVALPWIGQPTPEIGSCRDQWLAAVLGRMVVSMALPISARQ